ncbi:MAG: type II toxin-antitoxin system VapC family toxin [Cyclobacteriaceae bacterium]
MENPKRLKPSVKSLLDENSSNLYVSSLAMFEILHKKKIGKLDFDIEFNDLDFFEWVDLKQTHILQTQNLPLIHRDPFDRLLIAQSIVEEMPLITSDQHIHQYDFAFIKA